ncbi:unnamed protein product [Ceutorhynchus assimilis]|uniref:Uncharacterized protein n=1 Tax=Ceutorhynchus assimilis TaxID=467358 RepID=A0A9N9MHU4_9CUCU|nr:unnamed protein product [Ceutorhynchus assimilis]
MKAFIVLLVLGLAATSLARPELNFSEVKESIKKIKEARKKCQSNPATALDESTLKNLARGGVPPANAGAYALCISKTLNWQNADGSVNTAVIQSRGQAIFGNKPELQAIIDECAVAQENPEATAIHLFKCYRKYSPHHDEHEHRLHYAEVAKSVKKIKDSHEKCQANSATALEDGALKQVLKGGEAPANFGAYSLCVSKALEWQNEDGSINRAYLEERGQALSEGNDTTYKAILDECAVAQANPEATAVHLFKCYRKYASHHIG